MVAVVGAEDLDDGVAARLGARDADGVHRGLGPGVHVAPLRQAPAPLELLGDDDPVLGRRGEVRALGHPLGDGLRDDGVAVALHHRAEAVVVVDHAGAVDVPHVRAVTALEVDRPRVAQLVGRRDAAGQRAARPGVHGLRGSGALVQPLRLALRQFGDALAVELHWGSGGHRVLLGSRTGDRPGSQRCGGARLAVRGAERQVRGAGETGAVRRADGRGRIGGAPLLVAVVGGGSYGGVAVGRSRPDGLAERRVSSARSGGQRAHCARSTATPPPDEETASDSTVLLCCSGSRSPAAVASLHRRAPTLLRRCGAGLAHDFHNWRAGQRRWPAAQEPRRPATTVAVRILR